MSSHRRRVKHFGRKTTHWTALFRSLMISLVEHNRITTTVDKAKELRRHIERAVTLSKKNDLASRRLLLSRIPHEKTVHTLMTDVSPRFKDRNGGYTRIIKIGRRPGDSAEMAFIEFVDYDWKKTQADESKGAEGGEKKAAKAKPKTAKKSAGALVAKKKSGAKAQQKKARATARG
jgi:large subunit ribosomal protein L17